MEELCHYRIFNGNFQIELQNKSKKIMPSIELMTCTSIDNLQNFDKISNDTVLSCMVDKEGMDKYISRVINLSFKHKVT